MGVAEFVLTLGTGSVEELVRYMLVYKQVASFFSATHTHESANSSIDDCKQNPNTGSLSTMGSYFTS